MSGIYPGSVRPLTDATPVDVALVDINGDQIAVSGALPVSFTAPARPATATITTLSTGFTGSQTALAANAARYQAIFFNSTNKAVNLAYAATATATGYSVIVPSSGSYFTELNSYTGIISAIWPSAPGAGQALHITEITT